MRGVVGPRASSTQAAATACVEIVTVNEVVIDNDVAATPTGLPSPSAPTTPATAKIESHVDASAETEVHPCTERRVKPTCIWIVERRTPNTHWIVVGHVHHLWIGRLDLDGTVVGAHGLLARRGQFPGLLRLLPHSLNSLHQVALLIQKRVAEVSRPGDVLVQAFDEIGKDYQGACMLGSQFCCCAAWVRAGPLSPGLRASHCETWTSSSG